jgi:hypothetical protein
MATFKDQIWPTELMVVGPSLVGLAQISGVLPPNVSFVGGYAASR